MFCEENLSCEWGKEAWQSSTSAGRTRLSEVHPDQGLKKKSERQKNEQAPQQFECVVCTEPVSQAWSRAHQQRARLTLLNGRFPAIRIKQAQNTTASPWCCAVL